MVGDVGAEEGEVDHAAGGHPVVAVGGHDIMDVHAAHDGAELGKGLDVTAKTKVLANLRVPEVVPVAEVAVAEVLENGLHFGFGGDGFVGGEDLEPEPDASGFEGGNEPLKAAHEDPSCAVTFFSRWVMSLSLSFS